MDYSSLELSYYNEIKDMVLYNFSTVFVTFITIVIFLYFMSLSIAFFKTI